MLTDFAAGYEPFEAQGRWWLPGDQESPVGGTLRFDADGYLTLNVVGVLEEKPTPALIRRYPVILGRTAAGVEVTLLACTSMHREGPHGDDPGQERLDAGRLYAGALLLLGADTLFSSVAYGFDNLVSWARLERVFTQEFAGGKRTFQISGPYFRSVPLPVGTLRLNVGASEESTIDSLRIERGASIAVDLAGPMTAKQIFDSVTRPLQHFLTLATDAPCQLRWLSFGSADFKEEMSQNFAMFKNIYCVQRGDTVHHEEQDDFLMVLPLRDCESNFESLLQKWFEQWARVSPAMDLLFGTQLGPRTYMETRFLLLAQAAEVYSRLRFPEHEKRSEDQKERRQRVLKAVDKVDREFLKDALAYYHEPTFAEKLQGLVNHAGGAITAILPESTVMCDQIKFTRNYFTHYDETSKQKAVTEPEDLNRLSEHVTILLQFCVLRDLGYETGDAWDRIRPTQRCRSLMMTQ